MNNLSANEGDLVAMFDALLGIKGLRLETEFEAPVISDALLELLVKRCAKAILWHCVRGGAMRRINNEQRYAETLPLDWLRFSEASETLITKFAHNAGLFMGSVRLRNEQSVGKRWAKKFVNSRCMTLGDELLFLLFFENLEKTFCKEEIIEVLQHKMISLSALSAFLYAPRSEVQPPDESEIAVVFECLKLAPKLSEQVLAKWPRQFESQRTPALATGAFTRAAKVIERARTMHKGQIEALAPLFKGIDAQLQHWHALDDLRLSLRESARSTSIKEGERVGRAALYYFSQIIAFYDERDAFSQVAYVDERYEDAQRYIGVFDENLQFERGTLEMMLRQVRGVVH